MLTIVFNHDILCIEGKGNANTLRKVGNKMRMELDSKEKDFFSDEPIEELDNAYKEHGISIEVNDGKASYINY